MTVITIQDLDKKKALISSMMRVRQPYWTVWREIATYLSPMRLQWLMSPTERTQNWSDMTNPAIFNGTGTLAAQTLAAGLMNGIASPARPWFKLRLVGFGDDISRASRVWLDEVERRMRYVIAESNCYNALAVFFLDLSQFATASMSVFEDEDTVFHCQNHAVGEYYIDLDNRLRVCTFSRKFQYTVLQLIQEFGEENVSIRARDAYKAGGARLLELIAVTHLCEPNLGPSSIPSSFKYREYYWEDSTETPGQVLRAKGYNEKPSIVARWEVVGNSPYGIGPGMNALGDIKQLQHEVKKKAQAMDKMVSPPILADIMLENRPLALLPNGVTFVPRLDATNGAKPIYEVNPPLGEMTADIQQIEQRIRDTFYNFLFNKVTSLPTVRSAREIDAIEGEKLVLLGSVLERFENECLDPLINRIFNIMTRRGLFPPAPREIQQANLQIQYVSIIASAQSAAGTTALERFLQLGGAMFQVWPEIREVPEIVDAYIGYGEDLGVPAKYIRSRDQVAQVVASQNKSAQDQQQLNQIEQITNVGKTLSQAQAGEGGAAIQRLLTG